MGYLPPGKALPDCETYRNCRVEVTTGRGCAGYDCKSDAEGESPADLKYATKGRDADGALCVEGEGGDGCDTREAVDVLAIMTLGYFKGVVEVYT